MGKKILIIEDSESSARMMEGILQKEGYEIALAANGKEGLERSAGENFDLALIDIVLPDTNGLEVCRKIRESNIAHQPKIICITGVIDAIDVVGARRSGADDFCVKTKNMVNLVEAVKKLI